jgi:two-component system response regulator AtoC
MNPREDEPAELRGGGSSSSGRTAGRRRELVVYLGGQTQVRRLPDVGALVLGRDPACDIVIPDRSVSAKHARLEVGPNVYLVDMGSRNGIRVWAPHSGDETFRQELVQLSQVDLSAGTPVQIGAATLLVRPVAATEEDARVIRDPAMKRIDDLLGRVGPSDLSVLLLGETGVGKEGLAERVHRASGRKGRLQPVHCAALAETLLESELFGHERGAFTGAAAAKAGLFELAQGGTVFLDEVGELSQAMQVKLLRVLEDRTVTRVGGVTGQKLDLRFVAASNRDLEAEVERGTFRRDLLFRLSGLVVRIPPLRERPLEVVALAEAFLERAAARLGRGTMRFSPQALRALENHRWPGNVRELRQSVERAAVLSADSFVAPADLQLAAPAAPSCDGAFSAASLPPSAVSAEEDPCDEGPAFPSSQKVACFA